MESDLPANIDKATFLAWMQTRERRYELVDGNVVAIGPNTLGHALVTGNAANALHIALNCKRWDILTSFGVDTGAKTVRDPDVLVDSGGDGKDVIANAPALLAEVLSPSSTAIDLGDKLAEYLKIPSLMAYLVLSQDEPKAWLWTRHDGHFNVGPQVCAGIEAAVPIAPLGLALNLSEIYDGITFA